MRPRKRRGGTIVNHCPCFNGGTCVGVSTWCRYAGRYDLTGAEHMGYTWVIDREGNVTAVDDDDAAVAWTQLAPLGNSAECPPSERPCARVRMQYPGHSTTDVYVGYLWVAGTGGTFRLQQAGSTGTLVAGTVSVSGYGDAGCGTTEGEVSGRVCSCPDGTAGDSCQLTHPCDTFGHNCDTRNGGICMQRGRAWQCQCRVGYVCVSGCGHGHNNHTCARTELTPAPTPAPTPEPSQNAIIHRYL